MERAIRTVLDNLSRLADGRHVRRPIRARARPTVEALENRDLLATLLWIGESDQPWSTVTAWRIVGTQTHIAPQNGDTLIFGKADDGTMGRLTASRDDMAGLTLAGLKITPEYGLTVTLQQDLTVRSLFSMANGTLAAGLRLLTVNPGAGATASVTWSGGSWDGYFRFEQPEGATTTVTINNAGEINFKGFLTNYGAMAWSGSETIRFNGTGVWTNNGTFDIRVARSIVRGAGLGAGVSTQIINKGTLQKEEGGTATIGVDFKNEANFVLLAGIMKFTRQSTQVSGATELLGGDLEVANSYLVDGGIFSGRGQVRGDLDTCGATAPGATVRPGLDGFYGLGTIAVTGYYCHGANATLEIYIDAAGAYGQLRGQGTVALVGGRLLVNRHPDYRPTSATLDVLVSEAGPIQGAFGVVSIPANTWTVGGAVYHFEHDFSGDFKRYQLWVAGGAGCDPELKCKPGGGGGAGPSGITRPAADTFLNEKLFDPSLSIGVMTGILVPAKTQSLPDLTVWDQLFASIRNAESDGRVIQLGIGES